MKMRYPRVRSVDDRLEACIDLRGRLAVEQLGHRVLGFYGPTDSGSIMRILVYLGEHKGTAHRPGRSRSSLGEGLREHRQDTDLSEPPPEFELHQRVSW
jgi:hypothetical protein